VDFRPKLISLLTKLANSLNIFSVHFVNATFIS